jgi:hypothetical protein
LAVLFQIILPAVSIWKPAMEEEVAFLTGHFETDVPVVFSLSNRLLAFAANDSLLEFQRLPPRCFVPT